MAAPDMSMKLLIDNNGGRILFAEAGKDVVDFIFGLLSLPLGTVTRILTSNEMVGSIGNMYKSIEDLKDTYMLPQQNKESLLNPAISNPDGNNSLVLLQNDQQLKGAGVGFVKGVVTYMIMDDLTVKPMSTISSMTMLNKFNVKEVGALEEKEITLTMEEAKKLLRASLHSKTVLTDVFYEEKIMETLDEVLDIPLPELHGLKTLKVAFYQVTKDRVSIHTIRLPEQSTVADVINDLKTKVELSHPNAELRLLEIFYHKIYKIFPLHEKIKNLNDQYWTLRAEEIPDEEKDLCPKDRLIHVYYFTKELTQNQMQIRNFGEPFLFVIHEGETVAEVKLRIQKKLQVPDEAFAKWNFAFLLLNRPDYLLDTDILLSRFQKREIYGAWEQYLGIEHSYTAPKRFYANQTRHASEKRVKKN